MTRPGHIQIVSKEAAKQIPYPYVFVEEDGSVRELAEYERKYLETEFFGADSGRPATKASYNSRFPSGHRQIGYLARRKLPLRFRLRRKLTPPSLSGDS